MEPHFHPFLAFIGIVLMVIPAWRIVSKAGYNGAWALLLFIPLVNIIMMYVFAFNVWPIERSRTP
jgi:fucose permease